MQIFTKYTPEHFYKYTEKSLEDGINPLLDYLFYRPKWYQIKAKYILYRYKKFLRKQYTPSYEFLCGIYDFICTCENIYMWPNTSDALIYAYRKLKPGIRSFRISIRNIFDESKCSNSDDEIYYTIEYTLYPKGQINLAISRGWGDSVKTDISFTGGEPMNLSVGDQILFDNIINETMDRVVFIFNKVYTLTKHVKLQEASDIDSFSHGR